MVSTPTVHGESALLVESALPAKAAGAAAVEAVNPTSTTQEAPVVDRIDIDEPRDVAIVEENTDVKMADDAAKDILNKYGFGAGMRMYARSLALAELAEQKEQAERVAMEQKIAADEIKEATKPKSSIVVPSAKSVIDFETVRSELSKVAQSIASLGSTLSIDYLGQSKNTKKDKEAGSPGVVVADDDDDDVIEAISGATGGAKVRKTSNSGGCCGADVALEEIFREADIWAEEAYNKMSNSDEKATSTTKRSSKKSWWSSLFTERKEVKEGLQLDSTTAAAAAEATTKHWWNAVLCAPVIADEEHINTSTTSKKTEEPVNERNESSQ